MYLFMFNQRVDKNNIRSSPCRTLFTVWFAILFHCLLIVETAFADLSTIPPLVNPVKQQEQIQIESIIAEAHRAINENRLTTPVNNNAVYLVKQLFILSPRDKRGYRILSEVSSTYTVLAYKELNNNQISQAQIYHDKAKMIARNFNITFDSKPLANLKREIIKRRNILNRLKSVSENQTKPSKTSTKTVKPVQKEPFTVPQKELPQRKLQVTPRPPLKSFERQDVAKKPVLSPAEQNRIVVIVNKQNNVSSLSLRELKSIYKGHHKIWSNGEVVTLYLPPLGSDAHSWFLKNIFQNSSPVAVPQFYMGGLIRNEFTKIPETSTNSVSDVSRIAGSIAIVKFGEIKDNNSIKIVPVDGI